MITKVYIDGQVGTTGLRIRETLAERRDLKILNISDKLRKEPKARQELFAQADISILCLPDSAAREVAAWSREYDYRLIDASTAHRVDEDWVYGLPELSLSQRPAIARANYVSNPGCYASAFILLVKPLVDEGVIESDSALAINALSGYSGGGKQLIENWEHEKNELLALPYAAPYAYERVHKHIPEMTRYSGLETAPQFLPSVGPFYSGMRVEVPLHREIFGTTWTPNRIHELYMARYGHEKFVRVLPYRDVLPLNEASLDPRGCNGTNRLDMHVIANAAGHAVVVGILDNLGKGACGVAIQNLNIMLGVDELCDHTI